MGLRVPLFLLWLAGCLGPSLALAFEALPKPPESYLLQAVVSDSPTSVPEAEATLVDRQEAALNWAACGDEIQELWNGLHPAPNLNPVDIVGAFSEKSLIAKVQRLKRHPGQACTSVRWFSPGWDFPLWPGSTLRALGPRLDEVFVKRYGGLPSDPQHNPPCGPNAQRFRVALPVDGWVKVTVTLSPACLREQVRMAMAQRVADIDREPALKGYAGSQELPCVTDLSQMSLTRGDYDMHLIGLLRLYLLDRPVVTRVPDGSTVLGDDLRRSVVERLFTVRGRLQPDSYSWSACGNTDRQQGSADDTVDEDHFFDDVGNALGDATKWLALFLALFVILLLVAALLTLAGAALGLQMAATPFALALVAAGGVGLEVVTEARIPETENHLLMINTSRLLVNQVLYSQATDQEARDTYTRWNDEISRWLLHRLQSIAQQGFIEYNSPSYSDLAQAALLNLHDFALDPRLKDAAALVLEIEAAKYAASHSEGRRVQPFRRKMKNIHEALSPEGIAKADNLYQLVHGMGGADYTSQWMQYYAGLAAQLPAVNVDGKARRVARTDTVIDWVFPATSSYRPSRTVLDWTLNPGSTVVQRVRHEGVEIYGRGQNFTISAGGVVSTLSTPLLTPISDQLRSVLPDDLAGKLAPFTEIGKCDDLGVGVPTTVQLSTGNHQLRADALIRFDGRISTFPSSSEAKCTNHRSDTLGVNDLPPPNTLNYSHDHNTCVHGGFACGTNLKMPASLNACANALALRAHGATAGSTWWFVDSQRTDRVAACQPWVPRAGQRYFLAVYQADCPQNGAHEKRCNNWGVVEVVDNPSTSFNAFRARVLDNGSRFGSPGAAADGAFPRMSYLTAKGQPIEFELEAHLRNPLVTDIRSVGGVDQGVIGNWPYLSGDIIDTKVPGRHVVKAHGGYPALDLDFSDEARPRIGTSP